MSGRETILMVTERRLFPVNEGTRARIVAMIRSLRKLGFSVVLITRRGSGRMDMLRTRWLVDRLVLVDAPAFAGGSPSRYDCTPFHGPVEAAVDRFAPAAVIAEYVWMAPCLDVVRNGALRFIDTIDLMHVRRHLGDRLSNVWVTCTAEEERRLLEKADAVIAIQPRELERFRQLVPGNRVICLPHHVQVRRVGTRGNRPVVSVIGSGNPGNVDGLRSFLAGGWPVVRRACPGAELRVFGELARAAPAAEGVIRAGYAASLRRAYAQTAVAINPVRVGTGLKIKTVEALAHGKALVTTPCGAEGLEGGAGHAFLVADDVERFGRAVAALLSDRDARARLEAAAAVFAETEFSLERVYGSFRQVLADRASMCGERSPVTRAAPPVGAASP